MSSTPPLQRFDLRNLLVLTPVALMGVAPFAYLLIAERPTVAIAAPLEPSDGAPDTGAAEVGVAVSGPAVRVPPPSPPFATDGPDAARASAGTAGRAGGPGVGDAGRRLLPEPSVRSKRTDAATGPGEPRSSGPASDGARAVDADRLDAPAAERRNPALYVWDIPGFYQDFEQ